MPEPVHELRGRGDVLFAVSEPAPPVVTGAARRPFAEAMRPVYGSLGFTHFKGGVWLLADWSAMEMGLRNLRRRFGIEVDDPPF